MKIKTLATLFFISLFMLTTCNDNNPFFNEPDFSTVPAPFPRDESKKTIQENGLIIYEVKEGTGDFTVQNRDIINGYYTGRKFKDNEVFDSVYKDGMTSYVNINLGAVNPQTGTFNFIHGFREGFFGMKQGGQRVVVIPPSLGYGGTSNALANDTLVFDIEVHSFVAGKRTAN